MLKALNEQIILKPILRSEVRANDLKSRTGLLIAKPEMEGTPNQGEVYLIGEGVSNVSPGQTVVFDNREYDSFKYDGQKLFRIHKDKVMAVING